jgi:formate/nitrite transporter FocA (FNT family)
VPGRPRHLTKSGPGFPPEQGPLSLSRINAASRPCYTVGFVIVILGNLHLFTESTVTAVLPLATHPTARNLGRLLRLWTVVFVANMVGTLFVSALVAKRIIV